MHNETTINTQPAYESWFKAISQLLSHETTTREMQRRFTLETQRCMKVVVPEDCSANSLRNSQSLLVMSAVKLLEHAVQDGAIFQDKATEWSPKIAGCFDMQIGYVERDNGLQMYVFPKGSAFRFG